MEEHVETEEIQGGHDVIHKVRAGEASEQRLQRRAEDSWQRNATEVAAHLDRLTKRHHPAVIVVAGDDRSIAALEEHASEAVKSRLAVIDSGGRASGTDDAAEEAAVRRAVETAIAGEVEQATARLLEPEGQQARAAQGKGELISAFRRGQVDTLLLSDSVVDGEPVRVGADGMPDGGGPDETVPAAVAFAAAALATDAEVVLVPAEVMIPDGAAAVLRWDDPATPHDSSPSMPGHGERPGWNP